MDLNLDVLAESEYNFQTVISGCTSLTDYNNRNIYNKSQLYSN